MAADRRQKAGKSHPARSAVTNASRLVQGADGRSAIARRFRDVYNEVIGDLGGADATSEAERQLARRAAALATYAENIEAKLARGEDVDSEDWVRIINALNRTFGMIGLQRRPRNATPSLGEYLEQQAGASP